MVDSCIKKFAEMIKYWPVAKKSPFIVSLAKELGNEDRKDQPTIPLLQLLTKLIKEHLAQPTGNTNNTNNY